MLANLTTADYGRILQQKTLRSQNEQKRRKKKKKRTGTQDPKRKMRNKEFRAGEEKTTAREQANGESATQEQTDFCLLFIYLPSEFE